MTGLAMGSYLLTLDPAGIAVAGQTAAAYVGGYGLTLNWSASPGPNAIASANPMFRRTLARRRLRLPRR
jgi:hypothetical protein